MSSFRVWDHPKSDKKEEYNEGQQGLPRANDKRQSHEVLCLKFKFFPFFLLPVGSPDPVSVLKCSNHDTH